MTQLEKIRQMDLKELASFLVIEGTSTETDYDYYDNPFTREVTKWFTPFGGYPGYWNREEVIDDLIGILSRPEDYEIKDEEYGET